MAPWAVTRTPQVRRSLRPDSYPTGGCCLFPVALLDNDEGMGFMDGAANGLKLRLEKVGVPPAIAFSIGQGACPCAVGGATA